MPSSGALVAAERRNAALERAAAPLGFDSVAAAAGARIVDNQMADAIRMVSLNQGLDPRSFAMYAYGDAGAVHATAVARKLGIRRVVIPLAELAAGWSAFGVAASDALIVESIATPMKSPFDPQLMNAYWDRLEEAARERMAALDPVGEPVLERVAEMRYTAQIAEV
jgi:N-methylhydantoinase A